MSPSVLVIEDDPDVALAIRAVLEGGGLEVLTEGDGRAGLRVFHASRPRLVVLDVGLPVLDGWDVLDRIRDLSEVPVLMLTSHGLEDEKVRGLQAGADDYVTKPFSNAELLARVRGLLRRGRAGQDPDAAQVYDDGLLSVGLSGGEVSVDGRPVSLTPTEFRLLAVLVRHRGQVLSPEQLLDQAWQDPAGIGPDRVKFTVMRLRRKLGQHGGAGPPIEAVRGFGYRYRPPR
ncbi:MAG TPA: response regulator transcription factor [Streptosporangiaceae bacterium]|jgi:DNA-binding response OmpR family regulator|nr:response regulator transcription factor [Streptosporangiaceae bacterium]